MSLARRPERFGRRPYEPEPLAFYATEPDLTLALLPHIAQWLGALIREPCCGDGAIARVLHAAGHRVMASDIADRGYGECGVDFLALRNGGGAAGIVTNPPYNPPGQKNLHERILRHALDLMARVRGFVAMLLPFEFDTASTRHDLFAAPPFRAKVTCCWRPHWIAGTEPANPMASFAWFIWDWAWQGVAQSLYALRPA